MLKYLQTINTQTFGKQLPVILLAIRQRSLSLVMDHPNYMYYLAYSNINKIIKIVVPYHCSWE